VWFIIGNDTLKINVEGVQPIHISKELVELYYFARLHLKSVSPFPNNVVPTDAPYTDNIVRVTQL